MPLASELRSRGLEVVELPCIRIEPLEDASKLEHEIAGLRPTDVLVLTSAAAVDAIARLRIPVRCDVAVVGPATDARARDAGLSVSFVSAERTAVALGRTLPLPRGTVVLARSDRADDELPARLRERGATVRTVVAYRTVAEVSGGLAAARSAIAHGAVVVVASPSAVDALRDAFGTTALRKARFVSIGLRTAAAVRHAIGTTSAIVDGLDARAIAEFVCAPTQEVIA